MRQTLLRSLVFAAAVVAVSMLTDLLLAVLEPGDPLQSRGRQFFIFRIALHGATFVFTAVGATLGFALLRPVSMTFGRIALLGAALGLLTFTAVRTAIHIGGYWGITVWLIVAAALVAFFGGKTLADKEAHR